MLSFGDIVGHNRCEQCVNRTEAGKGEAGDDGGFQYGAPVEPDEAHLVACEKWQRQSRRNLAYGRYTFHVDEERHHGHHQQCYQS